MDQPTIEDVDDTALLIPEQMDTTHSNTDYEQLQRQVEELTKQLDESQSAERHANDEREKYVQLYNQTNERFLAIEHQQLDQLQRIFNILTSDQQPTLSENEDDSAHSEQALTNSSTSILLPSLLDLPLDQQTPETDQNDVLKQISELLDTLENFLTKSSEEIEDNNQLSTSSTEKQEENVELHLNLSLLQAEYEQERQMRHHFEKQFHETNKLIEMDHTKRIQKLRNYAALADDEGDILLSSLMKKAEKNDIDFREMKLQYENVFTEQVNQIKKLVKERELLHLYIERLERENVSLAARTMDDETIQFLTYSSKIPTSYEECLNLIQQLREVIIEQLKIQDKLRNDEQQSISNHKTEIREREQIEELAYRDLNTAKDQIQSVRSEYEHVLKVKNTFQRELEECTNELIATRTVIDYMKEQTEEISLKKETFEEENVILRDQIQQLKMDFQNSESVQHDFVKLSQALQVQLEEFRNSAHELRWQHEEDFSECQRCHVPFSMTWRRQHCHHCGKVLCKDCVNKVVHSGPNNRPSRVCNVCYTLLNKTSQPYFHANVPKV